jgi:hypothetical protein
VSTNEQAEPLLTIDGDFWSPTGPGAAAAAASPAEQPDRSDFDPNRAPPGSTPHPAPGDLRLITYHPSERWQRAGWHWCSAHRAARVVPAGLRDSGGLVRPEYRLGHATRRK